LRLEVSDNHKGVIKMHEKNEATGEYQDNMGGWHDSLDDCLDMEASLADVALKDMIEYGEVFINDK